MDKFKARDQSERLINWFDNKEFPKDPFQYRHGHRIVDGKKFFNSQVHILRTVKQINVSWKAAYFRLYNLKKFIEQWQKDKLS